MQIKQAQKAVPDCIRNELKKIYHTADGQIARKLNKTAQYKIPQNLGRNIPCKDFYPYADKRDLALLISSKEEDLLKKCTFINPKDLKEYNILLKNKNPDGTLTVRILDDCGKFLKEGNITPKNIVVLDNFRFETTSMYWDDCEKIPHGDIVKRLIQRSNPFNNYEFIDISSKDNLMQPFEALKKLIQRIEKGEKIDAISCSFAREYTYEELETFLGQPIKNKPMVIQKNIIQKTLDKLSKANDSELRQHYDFLGENCTPEFLKEVKEFLQMSEEIKIYTRLKNLGVKIFMGSGNNTKVINKEKVESINFDILAEGVEGVGALSKRGDIAQYSGTRKSIFTPHYEKGDLSIQYRENGINYSGGPGIDLAYSERAKAMFREISNLSPYSNAIESSKGGYFYKGIPVDLKMSTQTVVPLAIVRDGTSWATPRRVGEFTKYQILKDLI